ncbi:MAG: hypothetical protein H6855_00090 [Rhodospirillales bacterium]|nr:hypothetical protein [Rhodospirillales bacterium]
MSDLTLIQNQVASVVQEQRTPVCMIVWMEHASETGAAPVDRPSHVSVFLSERDALKSVRSCFSNRDIDWCLADAGGHYYYPAGPDNGYVLYTGDLPAEHALIEKMTANNGMASVSLHEHTPASRAISEALRSSESVPIAFPRLNRKPRTSLPDHLCPQGI